MSSKCPLCGKPADPVARPFCSKRCADVDLQRWLSGRYVVPGTDEDEENPLSEEIVRNDD
ncbi:MAG: DNA gyrase inhibitor YacG [bacterium]|nr:DNA gyrase inhibitor YacG [Alphaproteobacteria bacterium]MDI1363338.1 DNA gyrase inhibitor YacG [bacterium]